MRYLFEEYAFDTDRREMHRGADVISVTPQVFDLLDYLIRNRERVVSKDDLINVIWNGRSVSDAALTTRLNAARTAIGDSGEQQRFIKTLPRKGFRFVGAVREMQGPAGAEVADNPVEQSKPTLTLPNKPSIAVLPFANLSSDAEQEYFADGVVEDITMALSLFPWLFVIARNSSFTYKGRAVDVKQVGRELGVRYVLEGSVRKAGNRMRIAGQLIDAETGAHLWADHFDGALEDMFDLQDHVTASVVGAIAPKRLLPAWAGETSFVEDQGGERRGTPAFSQRDRARPWSSLRLWHGSLVLRATQGAWLDDRARARERGSYSAGPDSGASGSK